MFIYVLSKKAREFSVPTLKREGEHKAGISRKIYVEDYKQNGKILLGCVALKNVIVYRF